MQRNLFGISAKGVVLKAAAGLYAIVFCQAIVQDALWLWILSIAGGLVIIALFGAPHQDSTPRARQMRGGPFMDPVEALGMPRPGPFPLKHAPGPAPLHRPPQEEEQEARSVTPMAAGRIPPGRNLTKERRQALQLILLDSPPICLN